MFKMFFVERLLANGAHDLRWKVSPILKDGVSQKIYGVESAEEAFRVYCMKMEWLRDGGRFVKTEISGTTISVFICERDSGGFQNLSKLAIVASKAKALDLLPALSAEEAREVALREKKAASLRKKLERAQKMAAKIEEEIASYK